MRRVGGNFREPARNFGEAEKAITYHPAAVAPAQEKRTYGFKIFFHAHGVFCSVALIKLFQPGAGKAFVIEAESVLSRGKVITVLYSAGDAVLCFSESSTRQPGQVFFSRVKARHRRQFMPQGAVSFVGIVLAMLPYIKLAALNNLEE